MTFGHVAHRHRDRAAGVGHLGPPHHSVGLLHGDRAHHVVADVLLDLERQRPRRVFHGHVDVQRVVDLRHLLGAELDVDDRPGHPHHAAGASLAAGAACGTALCRCGHAYLLPAVVSVSALAPPTISLISCVISACRALLASRVRLSTRSLALSVAAFMALRRDAISAAEASSRAWKMRLSTYHGSSASSTSCADGSNS